MIPDRSNWIDDWWTHTNLIELMIHVTHTILIWLMIDETHTDLIPLMIDETHSDLIELMIDDPIPISLNWWLM